MLKNDGIVTEEEIIEYLYAQLIERGHAPTSEVVEELANIFLDYLEEKGCPQIEE